MEEKTLCYLRTSKDISSIKSDDEEESASDYEFNRKKGNQILTDE
jgi:hypothetical protein